jgi:hypothetical protein
VLNPLGIEHLLATVLRFRCDAGAHALLAEPLVLPVFPSCHHFPCPGASTCASIDTFNLRESIVSPKIDLPHRYDTAAQSVPFHTVPPTEAPRLDLAGCRQCIARSSYSSWSRPHHIDLFELVNRLTHPSPLTIQRNARSPTVFLIVGLSLTMSEKVVPMPTMVIILLTMTFSPSAFFTCSVSFEFGDTITCGWSLIATSNNDFSSSLIVGYPFFLVASAQLTLISSALRSLHFSIMCLSTRSRVLAATPRA